MSHQPERKEKNCLNCGTIVSGRFCQNCGQENVLPKQTFWGMLVHFIYDIFHFDGKFFETLKYLMRPGFVPREYVAGKRVKYLEPIRMYLFTSALFFLIFFTFADPVKIDPSVQSVMSRPERLGQASLAYQQLKANPSDTVLSRKLKYLLDTSYMVLLERGQKPAGDSAFTDSSFNIRIDTTGYFMTVAKRDEGGIRVNGKPLLVSSKLDMRWKEYKRSFGDDNRAMLHDLSESFLHKIPYLLFISLPFFALVLKLLYRRRKEFFYSDHAIFTLYHYIFTFILFLVYFLVARLHDWLHWGFLQWLDLFVFLYGGVYLLISMKKFYAQRWGKTILKFLLLNMMAFFVVLVLFVGLVLFSMFQL